VNRGFRISKSLTWERSPRNDSGMKRKDCKMSARVKFLKFQGRSLITIRYLRSFNDTRSNGRFKWTVQLRGWLNIGQKISSKGLEKPFFVTPVTRP